MEMNLHLKNSIVELKKEFTRLSTHKDLFDMHPLWQKVEKVIDEYDRAIYREQDECKFNMPPRSDLSTQVSNIAQGTVEDIFVTKEIIIEERLNSYFGEGKWDDQTVKDRCKAITISNKTYYYADETLLLTLDDNDFDTGTISFKYF